MQPDLKQFKSQPKTSTIMKKATTILLLAAAILVGCSNPPSNENIAQQKLLGEWQMTSYTATDLRNEQTR